MDAKAELKDYFLNTRPLLVRTSGGREAVGRVIFLDEHIAEIHPCPRHPRSAAIPRWKFRVDDIASVQPAPAGYRDDGGRSTVEEMRERVGPQEDPFIRK